MSTLRVIAPALPNLPWEDRPGGCSEALWCYSRNPILGRDATPMRGRDGTDTSYETDTLNIGPGESYDVLFTAPPKTGSGAYDTYYLYNRSFSRSNNLVDGGFGGQATEIRVYASGVAAQSYPNDWGI